MIFQYAFLVPTQEGMFDRSIQILKNEYGLVEADDSKMISTAGPLPPQNTDKTMVLVWEDQQGLRRYRVRIEKANPKETKGNVDYDFFQFQYWLTERRIDKDLLKQDPMKETRQRIWLEAEELIHLDKLLNETTIEEAWENTFK